MSKCNYYQESRYNVAGLEKRDGAYVKTLHGKVVGRCLGTKECEECYCGGDTSKCDFYSEKRAQTDGLSTVEMYQLSHSDDLSPTFLCRDKNMLYNKETGFVDLDTRETYKEITSFMESHWELVNTISRKEAEERCGAVIVG